MKKHIWILVIIFILFIVKKPVIADETTVANIPIINEAYPKPNADEKEWIEIFNNNEESIDLSGWILMDELSSPSVIHEFEQEILEPSSFLVIELSTNKLNNSADTIKLLNPDNEVIDEFSYSNSELEMSFALIDNELGILEITLSTPTKGAPNPTNSNSNDNSTNESIQEEIASYLDLTISEIMACPEPNNPEWIKIKNLNDEDVNLNDWTIKDIANNQITLTADDIVPQLGSNTILLTNNILNNSGDTIYLFNPNDVLVDQFSYSQCTLGTALIAGKTIIDTPIKNNQDTKSEEDAESSKNTESHENTKSTKQIDSTNNQKNGKNAETNTNTKKIQLKKINTLLKATSIDKKLLQTENRYVSKHIIIKNKSLDKTTIISVIIGGAILSSSGLFFINIPINSNE